MALGSEPADPGVMRRPPRPPAESVLGAGLWQRIVRVGVVIAAVTLGVALWGHATGRPWQTMAFFALGTTQLAVAAGSRARPGTLANPALLAAIAVRAGAPARRALPAVPARPAPRRAAPSINPPWMSLQLYHADSAGARYYLDLFGASHLIPYQGTNPVERLMARVTLAFFDRYVLGQADAQETMTRDGNVTGTAALVSGGQPPP